MSGRNGAEMLVGCSRRENQMSLGSASRPIDAAYFDLGREQREVL